jgi:hypothetical protein
MACRPQAVFDEAEAVGTAPFIATAQKHLASAAIRWTAVCRWAARFWVCWCGLDRRQKLGGKLVGLVEHGRQLLSIKCL